MKKLLLIGVACLFSATALGAPRYQKQYDGSLFLEGSCVDTKVTVTPPSGKYATYGMNCDAILVKHSPTIKRGVLIVIADSQSMQENDDVSGLGPMFSGEIQQDGKHILISGMVLPKDLDNPVAQKIFVNKTAQKNSDGMCTEENDVISCVVKYTGLEGSIQFDIRFNVKHGRWGS